MEVTIICFSGYNFNYCAFTVTKSMK